MACSGLKVLCIRLYLSRGRKRKRLACGGCRLNVNKSRRGIIVGAAVDAASTSDPIGRHCVWCVRHPPTNRTAYRPRMRRTHRSARPFLRAVKDELFKSKRTNSCRSCAKHARERSGLSKLMGPGFFLSR